MSSNTPKQSRPPGTAPHPLVWTAVAITATAILALAVARVLGWKSWQAPTTVVASTGFVLVALLGGALRSPYGRFVMGALACCWTGDMVGPQHFMLGTYAFLAAHLLLIPAFLTLRPSWRAASVAGLAVGVSSAVATVLLWPHLPPADRVPILSYTLVISLMVFVAAGAGRRCRIIPLAAVLFYVSDLFVARWKYVGGDWNSLFCYPLYYTACLLFAYSVIALDSRQSGADSAADTAAATSDGLT